MSEPASANMTPIAGNATCSQASASVWYAMTRPSAMPRRRSKYVLRSRACDASSSTLPGMIGSPPLDTQVSVDIEVCRVRVPTVSAFRVTRSAAVARLPAAGVPVATVGEVAAVVGRPRHDVGYTRTDLLVAAGTAVRLGRSLTGGVTDGPLPVRRDNDPLDAAPRALLIEAGLVVPSPVLAGHDPS